MNLSWCRAWRTWWCCCREEIWLVDFKTDEIRREGLPDKIKAYAPQLKLYARALEKIYSQPVTARWLHFLAARRTEPI